MGGSDGTDTGGGASGVGVNGVPTGLLMGTWSFAFLGKGYFPFLKSSFLFSV